MAFRVLISKKGRLGGKQPPAVTLNFKMGRIAMLSNIYTIMGADSNREFGYIRLLVDDERPDVFLMQPCAEDTHGARSIRHSPGTSPSVSARYLFNRLGLPRHAFRRCPVSWDEEHGGWLVHWKESIEVEETVEPVPIRSKKIRERSEQ